MAKWSNDTGLDQALNWYADCDLLCVCSQQPATYAEATSTYKLADQALTPGHGNGDFTVGNGDVSGRKLTVGAQSGETVDTSGTATHIALVKSGDTTLRYVTTCGSQALTAGNPFTTNAFDIELADPT